MRGLGLTVRALSRQRSAKQPSPGPDRMAEPAPRETIYVNNINEKVSKDELKKSLYAAFSQFGPILDVIALKTFKMRGQAFVVFRDITAATQAVRQMQGFPFYEKPMMISYANSKSDAVAKLDGSYEAKDKAERASKRKAEREERKEAKKAALAKPKEVAEAGVATPAVGEAVAQHVESTVLGGARACRRGLPRGGGGGGPTGRGWPSTPRGPDASARWPMVVQSRPFSPLRPAGGGGARGEEEGAALGTDGGAAQPDPLRGEPARPSQRDDVKHALPTVPWLQGGARLSLL